MDFIPRSCEESNSPSPVRATDPSPKVGRTVPVSRLFSPVHLPVVLYVFYVIFCGKPHLPQLE